MTVCVACGERTPGAARYCQACGAALPLRPAPAHDVRKTVTVLFCDVVSSTALGEGADPEAVRHVLTRFFDEMRAVVERHGGTVEKFIGDEVMAVFGVPVVHEDDALRAVRAAAEMRERLRALNDELGPARGVRLECRFGIDTGEVVAGDPATGSTFVTGEPVVVAKRLQTAAAPGEILVGTATYPLVRDAVRVGPRRSFRAKGKREPLRPWLLDAVEAGADGVRRRLEAPLVGRDAELARLRAAFEAAVADRSCRLVTVLGPPGIGKSRLARELLEAVRPEATTLAGRCLPYGEAITFWPLAEVVRAAGGEAALAGALAGEEDAELVAAHVRAAIGRAEAPGGDETFWAVRRFLEALARERPLVVCLEDLHWAAPRFLDLVEYLAGWTRDVPLLLLCLARGDLLDRRPEWVAPRAGAEALALEPLAGAEADALVRAASGEAALPEATRAWIAATAEGNPLFVEQLAAAVLEAGAGEPPAIPPTIQALLAARLDRLEPAERGAIERAAVIGKQFTARAVADLSPPEEREAVGRRLAALLRKELVRPERGGPGGGDAFAFRHALIRDAAYEAMPKALRADLHARVARWLEEHAGERLPELEEILGHHLEQAHRLRVELGYRDAGTEALRAAAGGRLAAAGGRAFRREDMPAAAALLRRAAALLPARDAERLEALRRLGQACWDVGDAEGAEAAHEELLAAARAAGDRRLEAWALLERTVQRQFTTDAETVLAAARRAIAVFREAGDELGLARAWRRVAAAERRRGRYGEAERAGREALRHALAAGDGLEESHVVDGLCACLLYGPTPAEEGLRLCREMLARARRPSQTANVLSAVAGLEALQGRFPEAREAYGRAAAIFEELGLRVPLAGLTQVGVPLELLAGDPAAAEREARRGLAVLEGLGQAAVQAPLLATALLAAGRDAEAAEALAAVDPEAAPQLAPWWVIWHAAHARLELRAGRSGEALAHAEDAVRLAEGTDDPSLAGDAWLALAEARRARGDGAGAEAAAAAARERFARKGNVAGSRLAASPA